MHTHILAALIKRHSLIVLSCCSLVFGFGCSEKEDNGKKDKGSKVNKSGDKGKTDGTGVGDLVEAGTKVVTSVDVGALTSCALFKDGTVRCWGSNLTGQLGIGKTPDELLESYVPVEVTGAKGATKMWVGASRWRGTSERKSDTVCTQEKSGRMSCWGHNGRLYGDGTHKHGNKPQLVALNGVVDLDSHSGTACAVYTDKTAACWGSGALGKLGNGKGRDEKLPVKVTGLTNAKEISCGQKLCCSLSHDGTVSCWGSLPTGEVNVPAAIPGFKGGVHLSALRRGVCTLDGTGLVSCWGRGYSTSTAVPIIGAETVTQMDAEFDLGCGVKKDKTVVCWSKYNQYGELGDGTQNDSPSAHAVVVKGVTNALHVAVGEHHACAVTADNKVMCWGKNSRGQLGDGTITDRATAVEVKGLTAKTLAKAGERPLGLPADKKTYKPDGTPPAGCPKQTAMRVHVRGKLQQFLVRHARIEASPAATAGGATGYLIELQNYDDQKGYSKPMPRGGQIIVKFSLDRSVVQKSKDGKELYVAAPLDLKGGYKPGWQEKFRSTRTAGIYDRHQQRSFDAGQIRLTHLSDKWICGDVDLSDKKQNHSLKGAFALPVPAKKKD